MQVELNFIAINKTRHVFDFECYISGKDFFNCVKLLNEKIINFLSMLLKSCSELIKKTEKVHLIDF